MLRKLKRKRTNHFSTVDIETDKEGNLLIIGCFDGTEFFTFQSWSEFFAWLKCATIDGDKRYTKWIAHNGGGFDYVHMVVTYLQFSPYKFECIMAGSDIVCLDVLIADQKISFIDSLKTLQKGLKGEKGLCKTFGEEHLEEDFDIDNIGEIWRKNPTHVLRYLESDVKTLYNICHKFMVIFGIEFFPVTLASLSLYLYRLNYLTENLIALSDIDDDFITRAYAGGRVECFKTGQVSGVNTYDINSLYPYVMQENLYPSGKAIRTKKLHPSCHHLGFYEIDFEQKNRKIPPVLWIKSENGLEFVYKGTGVFYITEIESAIKHGVKITVKSGLVFSKKKPLFRNFVSTYYKQRLENKGSAIDYACKILMNSLYGKFAEREEKSRLIKLAPEEFKKIIADADNTVEPYIPEYGLCIKTEEREVAHRMPYLSAAITANARVLLYGYLAGNSDRLVYCDTDSLHIVGNLTENIGSEIGQWKAEESGNGVYLGRKQYTIAEKIKFKGVRTKDKLLKIEFTGQNFIDILQAGSINYAYGAFPKLKSCLKGTAGAKPAVIQKITKKCKQADFQTNFRR